MSYTVKELKEKNLIIFEAHMGSHAYGTSLPTSDIDIRGIFIQPLDDILRNGYVDQVSDETNDTVYYELRRFMVLLQKNNPNILEILYAPDDIVLKKHRAFELIEKHRDKFLTKKCKYTFAGYAINQIRKAKGYNKKINWEKSKIERKGVLDFCYVLDEGGSVPLDKFLEDYNSSFIDRTFDEIPLDQSQIGLSKIDHAHDVYAMYDLSVFNILKGIVSDPEKANDVQLSSIPEGQPVLGYLMFNKDAYSTHCKNYKSYQTWVKERNEARYNTNMEHGKNYDSKNMMHTFRLLNVANEVATKGELNVRRPPEEIEILMKIRRGEYDLDELLEKAEEMISGIDEMFDNSSLPENIDSEFLKDVFFKARKYWYSISPLENIGAI